MLKSTLLLSLTIFSLGLYASGGSVGNGGDTIFCKPLAASPFYGHYTLDYLLEYKTSSSALRTTNSADDSFKKISSILHRHYPALGQNFDDFIFGVRKNYPYKGRHWIETKVDLLDIKDENVIKRLPSNCDQFYQTVIRKSFLDPIEYQYDGDILEHQEKHNPVQYSFFIVHEWLWDFTRDVRALRKLNWIIHSEKFDTISKESLKSLFINWDLFSISSLDLCDRSNFIKNIFDVSCEQLNFAENVMKVYDLKVQAQPRIGDFFGFTKLKSLKLIKAEYLLPRVFYSLFSLEQLDLSESLVNDVSDLVLMDLHQLKKMILNDQLRTNIDFLKRIRKHYPYIQIQ